jgi:uncharacterized protein CbrC (UPF0167 family)
VNSHRVVHPDSAETGGLSSCLGLGILNTRKRIGYLGHYYGWDEVGAERLVDWALAESDDVKELFVTLAGCFPPQTYPAEYEEQSLEKFKSYHKWLIEMLLAKGIPQENISNKIPRGRSDHISFTLRISTSKLLMKVWDRVDCNED